MLLGKVASVVRYSTLSADENYIQAYQQSNVRIPFFKGNSAASRPDLRAGNWPGLHMLSH